jgi:hypothetical protein
MGTLLTGQQGTPALCTANRVFFLFFIFLFWGEFVFLKKCVPICLFLSRCTHTLGILWYNVFHQRELVIMTRTRCYVENKVLHASSEFWSECSELSGVVKNSSWFLDSCHGASHRLLNFSMILWRGGSYTFFSVDHHYVYYQAIKRELNRRLLYECRCDERLKAKAERSTRIAYTGLRGGLEHLKIETRLTDERFESVMGECVI